MMNNNLYNKDFRKKLLVNPKKAMSEFNSELMNDVKVVVKKNTSDVTYFVMPDRSMLNWGDDTLSDINAAGHVGSVGTAGTASSVGSASSCISSVSTAGSASTAGTK